MMGSAGYDPANCTVDPVSAPLPTPKGGLSKGVKKMAGIAPVEGRAGFEPTTFCCASSCTSACASRPYRR